jgi:hypothetical protein
LRNGSRIGVIEPVTSRNNIAVVAWGAIVTETDQKADLLWRDAMRREMQGDKGTKQESIAS